MNIQLLPLLQGKSHTLKKKTKNMYTHMKDIPSKKILQQNIAQVKSGSEKLFNIKQNKQLCNDVLTSFYWVIREQACTVQ